MTIINENVEKIREYVNDNVTSDKIIKYLEECRHRVEQIKKEGGSKTYLTETCFAFTQVYNSLPIDKTIFESHKKYVDIQCILEGEEIFGIEDVSNLEIEKEYCNERDVIFYKTPSKFKELILKAPMYAVFFPNDSHLCCWQKSQPYRGIKVVVKVPLELMRKSL